MSLPACPYYLFVESSVCFAELDPSKPLPPLGPLGMGFGAVTVFGQPPPISVSMDEICPPAPECRECPEAKCFDGGFSLYHLVGKMQVKQLNNITFTGLPNRTLGTRTHVPDI